MARFSLKVRKWALGSGVAAPYDVVCLDNETGIMYASSNTFYNEWTASLRLENYQAMEDLEVAEHLAQNWLQDGSREDFDGI